MVVKQVNYYPANAAWTNMWTSFDCETLNVDFARIAGLGGDCVRLITFPAVFGYPAVDPAFAEKLSQAVGLADLNGLRVMLTLFDWWHDFTDVEGSKQWAASLLGSYSYDRRVAAVELKNELKLSVPGAAAWAQALMPYLKTLVPDALRTVSVADNGVPAFQALVSALEADPPDVWDYHFYQKPQNALPLFTQLKQVAAGRPLFIGETGQSTYGQTDLSLQASYLSQVCEACVQAGLPLPAPWCFSDFSAGAVPAGMGLSAAQSEFGLFRVDGSAKPSAAAVKEAFGA